jgi:hypothetical protein
MGAGRDGIADDRNGTTHDEAAAIHNKDGTSHCGATTAASSRRSRAPTESAQATDELTAAAATAKPSRPSEDSVSATAATKAALPGDRAAAAATAKAARAATDVVSGRAAYAPTAAVSVEARGTAAGAAPAVGAARTTTVAGFSAGNAVGELTAFAVTAGDGTVTAVGADPEAAAPTVPVSEAAYGTTPVPAHATAAPRVAYAANAAGVAADCSIVREHQATDGQRCLAAHENRAAEASATAAAARSAAAVATLGQGMANREVIDRGRDCICRVADEEDAVLIGSTDRQMRRAAAVDHGVIAKDQRQLALQRDGVV